MKELHSGATDGVNGTFASIDVTKVPFTPYRVRSREGGSTLYIWDMWFLVWGVLLGLAMLRFTRLRARHSTHDGENHQA
ncbi:hypothetical protein DFQ14_102149 [Halopolyspora algeriensis]|uniref:Uncharacterized protein n=1 Tax=Halopolyspora algeriensis TaxID=1500506 RepID=A0A368W1H3_9ACTN|nr:hypothetical protein DFQ14_102149 [Halopolyspora algeriensis]TQM55263.1 hypothetical protein FHU43_0023 [Halopolyspora algeriensis]